MLLKALDLLRTLGWGIINFIYSLIDSLFDILKEINALDIVNSLSNESMYTKLFTGIMAISLTLLGLFSVWSFVKKILEPDEGLNTEQIVKEIFKCGLLVLLSTFLFVQTSNLSIKLSGYMSTIFSSDDVTLGDNMLSQYVTYTESYKVSDDFKEEDISKYISNDNFTNKKMYNDKFVTNSRWILPDEKEYKYSINWIMAILVGGFFLYSLFFSGMMLARRQIEFLFLFTVAPIIFSTSIGNKQRRGAVFEQLCSLVLQGAVVMLIIGLTALLMKSIQSTTFFYSSLVKDMVIKSILYIGCGTFLLTGSQVVNRFVGGNVSANSGREQIMAMMGYGNVVKTGVLATGVGVMGASKYGLGSIATGVGKVGGDKAVSDIGKSISSFGNNLTAYYDNNKAMGKIGNTISSFGSKVGKNIPMNVGEALRSQGYNEMRNVVHSINPIGKYKGGR